MYVSDGPPPFITEVVVWKTRWINVLLRRSLPNAIRSGTFAHVTPIMIAAFSFFIKLDKKVT